MPAKTGRNQNKLCIMPAKTDRNQNKLCIMPTRKTFDTPLIRNAHSPPAEIKGERTRKVRLQKGTHSGFLYSFIWDWCSTRINEAKSLRRPYWLKNLTTSAILKFTASRFWGLSTPLCKSCVLFPHNLSAVNFLGSLRRKASSKPLSEGVVNAFSSQRS